MWTVWAYGIRLQSSIRPSSKFKLQQTVVKGQTSGLPPRRPLKNDTYLVGETTETEIQIENIPTKALLDTGSTISTMNENFYEKELKHLGISIYPITDILEVECANGEKLPYSGYIEVTISTNGLENSDNLPKFPLLIVPNNNYNRNVPILLGTNVLQYFLNDVQQQYGMNFLQKAKMFTPWYLTFRTMVLQQKELRRNNNRLGIIKSAENHCVFIPPNTSITINGYVDKGMPYHPTTALLHSTASSSIPNDL